MSLTKSPKQPKTAQPQVKPAQALIEARADFACSHERTFRRFDRSCVRGATKLEWRVKTAAR